MELLPIEAIKIDQVKLDVINDKNESAIKIFYFISSVLTTLGF